MSIEKLNEWVNVFFNITGIIIITVLNKHFDKPQEGKEEKDVVTGQQLELAGRKSLDQLYRCCSFFR